MQIDTPLPQKLSTSVAEKKMQRVRKPYGGLDDRANVATLQKTINQMKSATPGEKVNFLA